MQAIRFSSLVKNKDFDLYWLASAFSMGASNIFQYALSLYVLALTGSAVAFATMLAIITIPSTIFGTVAGVVCDRFSKPKLMAAINLLQIAVFLVFGYLFNQFPDSHLTFCYVLVVVLESVEVFYWVPEGAILSELVPEDLIEDAAAFSQIDNTIVRVLCPLVGALAYSTLEFGGIMYSLTILLAAAFIMTCFVKTPYKTAVQRTVKKAHPFKIFAGDFKEGLAYIKNSVFIRRFIWVGSMGAWSRDACFNSVLDFVLLEQLMISSYVYGVYQSILIVVSMVVPIFVTGYIKNNTAPKIYRQSFLLTAGVFLILSVVVAMGLNNSIPLMVTVLAIFACDATSIVLEMPCALSWKVVFQKQVDDECRGRVLSVANIARDICFSLGCLFFSWIAQTWSSSGAFVVSSVFLLASVVALTKLFFSGKPIPGEAISE